MSPAELRIRVVPAIRDIPAEAWNACANPTALHPVVAEARVKSDACPTALAPAQSFSQLEAYNPFISHDFLDALEASGSVSARAGWQPQHLIAETDDGAIVGVVPCYLKSHSRGEYVFDQGWAEAYEHAGGAYYPKLQVAVPFTPATGRRLLVRPGPQSESIRAALADALIDVCRRTSASSAHVTFP